MKKILVFFALFTALIFVVSCGSSSKTDDKTDSGETLTDADTADGGSAGDADSTGITDDRTDTESKNDSDSGDTTSDNSDSSDSTGDSGDSAPDEDGDAGDGDSQGDSGSDDDKVYSDCTVNSSEPCYTVCSEEKNGYFAWLNGTLVNKKCKDGSCTVSGKKIGAEPVTCEQYTTPPESCNPETSTMLCSPDGKSVWNCDGITSAYYDEICDAETRCVQCQNRAACTPLENCTADSVKSCNSVCNAESDGYYMWDANSESLLFHVCPQNDCIHLCGTAECNSGTGYGAGDSCEGSFGYCTKDGALAFTCEDGHIVQKRCKNNDCVYDPETGKITLCTAE